MKFPALTFALILSASPLAAQPSPDTVEALEAWLDTHSDWPRRDTPATITLSVNSVASAHGTRTSGRLRGTYDPDTATITLMRPWSEDDPSDLGTLLHELAHHRQAALHWYCPGAQELPAYRLQEKWHQDLGIPLDVNWIEVVMISGCSRRDVHPD